MESPDVLDARIVCTVQAASSSLKTVFLISMFSMNASITKRLCSQAEPEHRQIYQRLNLKELALPRKIAAVK